MLALADALRRRTDAGASCGSPASARRAAWRPGWCPPAATTCGSSRRCRCRASPRVDLLRVPGRVWTAVADTRALLRELEADVVVGFGGYVALPAYLAARRAKVPVVVHEQNALPGLANRIGARLAARVAVTVPGTPLHARRARRHAAADGDQLAGPRRPPGRGARRSSGWTPTGPRCWCSAARRARRR